MARQRTLLDLGPKELRTSALFEDWSFDLPDEFVQGPLWYRRLSPEAKAYVDGLEAVLPDALPGMED